MWFFMGRGGIYEEVCSWFECKLTKARLQVVAGENPKWNTTAAEGWPTALLANCKHCNFLLLYRTCRAALRLSANARFGSLHSASPPRGAGCTWQGTNHIAYVRGPAGGLGASWQRQGCKLLHC
jgi:hypothetical protein